MRFRKLLRDYLSFSKTEVNGMLVLIPLIILLLFSPVLYRQFFGLEYNTHEEDKRLLDSLISQINNGFNEEKLLERQVKYFIFNPNEASASRLESLGIPGFLSGRIVNYRSKGGRFEVKSDLSRIYDFPDSLYAKLEPYINLPDKKVPKAEAVKSRSAPSFQKTSTKLVKPEKEVIVLDLNEADTTALKRLSGIGSSYARRITAYRKLLGGYHSLSQLKEVYGMNDTLYAKITPFLSLSDSLTLTKLPINLATFKELLAHPYINYEQTKEILNLKSKHGKFRKPEDLFRLTLMDSVMIENLLPYIRF